jgi:hypothetical protein
LLDRALRATSDDELTALVESLDEDHREAIERLAGGDASPEQLRQAATKGRIDGTMESIALVLTDAALADCIKELGDHADNPTSDQLRAVLPGLVDRHQLGPTRLMLASTLAGEATASAVIRDLLKHDELVALPAVEPQPPVVLAPAADDPERAAIKARRQERKREKQADARTRREQSAKARGRS